MWGIMHTVQNRFWNSLARSIVAGSCVLLAESPAAAQVAAALANAATKYRDGSVVGVDLVA